MKEAEIQDRLIRHRQLSGAEMIALYDRAGFMRISSHDMTEERMNRLLDQICLATDNLREAGSLLPRAKPSFMIINMGSRYLYVSSLDEDLCLLAVFPSTTNFVKMMQAMGSITDEYRDKVSSLRAIAEKKKEQFLKEKKAEPPQPAKPTRPPVGRTLSALQVEALIEEFVNELGPAGRVIFDDTLRELGYEIKSLQRDQAIELIHRLANEIENLTKKEAFVKTALSIIES